MNNCYSWAMFFVGIMSRRFEAGAAALSLANWALPALALYPPLGLALFALCGVAIAVAYAFPVTATFESVEIPSNARALVTGGTKGFVFCFLFCFLF